VAGFFRLDEIAELANAGTLLAFIATAACMMILRKRAPDMPRVFRCPQPMLIGSLAILGCIYLIVSLPEKTLYRFALWNLVGIGVYLATVAGAACNAPRPPAPRVSGPSFARSAGCAAG
jgi:APA family basic amino acid/polyamine antiporter